MCDKSSSEPNNCDESYGFWAERSKEKMIRRSGNGSGSSSSRSRSSSSSSSTRSTGVLAGAPVVSVVVAGAVAAEESISPAVVLPGAAEAPSKGCSSSKSNSRSRAVARDAPAAVAIAEP